MVRKAAERICYSTEQATVGCIFSITRTNGMSFMYEQATEHKKKQQRE